jgi:hypothetical protein
MKKGNIGVMLSDDSAELYRVRFVGEDLIKVEKLSDGFTRWLYPRDFWVLIEELEGI